MVSLSRCLPSKYFIFTVIFTVALLAFTLYVVQLQRARPPLASLVSPNAGDGLSQSRDHEGKLHSFVKEDQNYAEIERRQNDVKRHLAEYCQRNDHKVRLPRLHRFQVIESPQLLYCMVLKVASRQWRNVLKRIRKYNKQKLKNLGQYNATDLQFFSRSFKFMFVREPFERLLSAYKDKFIAMRPSDHRYVETYGRKIIANFRPNATQKSLHAGDDVTFKEFIEYILKEGVYEGLNMHWNTYEDQCRPCYVHYDFIGRFEFLSQDANYLLKKTGVYDFIRFPDEDFSSTRDELLKYYSQIPLDWISDLGRIYRSNFDMFGYPFPGPLEPLFRAATGSEKPRS